MNCTRDDINRLIQFTDSIDEDVIIFKIDKNSLNNELYFANHKGDKLLSDYYGSHKSEIKLEDFLGLSYDDLHGFIIEKTQGIKLQEERILFTSNHENKIYRINYHVFNFSDGMLLQVVLKKVKSVVYLDDLERFEGKLSSILFSGARVVLLSLKNYESISNAYGYDMTMKLMSIIEATIRKSLSEREYLDRASRTFIFTLEDRDINPIKFTSDIVLRINKEIHYKFICDIKVGISSFSDNRYQAFREAKYSIHEIYNTDEMINDYLLLKDKQMLEYIVKSDLPKAIDKGELEVYFQGIFETETVELSAFEVLLRWNHSKLGSISPSDFIPIAEKMELVTELDLWVIENALNQIKYIDSKYRHSLKLNFNISPQDLLSDEFVDTVINLIEKSDMDFSNIILEITETLNLSPEKSGISKLKNKGILIALDDFGTGFSSLSQIKYYDIDFLKIDISFIRDINKSYDNTLITNAILALANSLKIKVIAEGIEENEQIDFLRNKKCDYLQGYKLHKPCEIGELGNIFSDKSINKVVKLENEMDYKDYVGFYQYGKLIYVSVNNEGEIVEYSSLLTKTLEYPIRHGEMIDSIIINNYVGLFKSNLIQVDKNRQNKSFMAELVGLRESIPVKVTIIKDHSSDNIDVFFEDYREKRDIYLRTRNIYNRYDLIFSNISTAIIVSDSDMIIHEWNRKAEEVFGYSREEAIGENVIKLLVREDLQASISKIAYDSLQGKIIENVNENVRSDGSKIFCIWKNTLLPNDKGETVGFISWVEDITEKLRIEEEINTLSTVIKQKPNPVVITDLKGNIEYVNNAFCDLTGYKYEEVIGKTPNILSSGLQSEEYYKNLWDTIEAGELWEGEFKNKKKNGDIYITESRVFPIKNEKNEVIKYCSIQRDMSREIEKDNTIREINNTLESQERLSMVGQMAAGIIHEINNPLSYIDMNIDSMPTFIEMIKRGEDTELAINELYDMHNDLKEGISTIKEIAAGLKRFAYKAKDKKFELFNLNDEIRTISVVARNEYKYFCELKIEEGEIEAVYGDAGKIKQVLLNLIINAVHAIRDKGHGWGKILIRTYQESEYVCCDIEDDGNGIPEEIQSMIFESFFTTKEEGVGTGLGLSLSKKIIENEHKGLLTFKSVIGKGTIFTIKFKRANI